MYIEIEKELLDTKMPLWLWAPDIPRYSIGWRMGAGDTYSWEFYKWWETLSPAAQQEYQKRYPEPIDWRGWYAGEDWDEDAEEPDRISGYELDGF
jgi:hypothetical protein